MIKQAMERGFLKAALDTGLSPLSAVTILKQANPMLEYLQSQMQQNPEMAGAAIGGLGGAGVGALTGGEHKGRNALLGGLGGAGLGAGIGHMMGGPGMPQDPQPAPPMEAGPEIPGVPPHKNMAKMWGEMYDLQHGQNPSAIGQLPAGLGDAATSMVDQGAGAMDTASDSLSNILPGGDTRSPGADRADWIMQHLNKKK